MSEKIFDLSPGEKEIFQAFPGKEKEAVLYTLSIAQDLKNQVDNDVPPEEGYYDETSLPHFFFITRILKNILKIIKEKEYLKEYLNFCEIQDFIRLKNINVKIQAIKLLDKINPELCFTFILQEKTNISGSVKSKIVRYLDLKSRANSFKRKQFLEYLENSFREDDCFTVIQILENLDRIKLTQEEFFNFFKIFIDYKTNPGRKHISQRVYNLLINYHESHDNLSLNLHSILLGNKTDSNAQGK